MRFSENRKLAFVVLVLCIVLSVFGLGGIGIAREYQYAMDIFNNGSDEFLLSVRHSIDAYLEFSAVAVSVMTSEGERIIGENALLTEMNCLADQIGDGEDLDARFAAYTDLKGKTDQLYNLMYDAAGDAFTDFKLAYDDFWGYENMIKFDDYHKVARDYNKLAGGFPGKIVAKIFGLGKLNTFGG